MQWVLRKSPRTSRWPQLSQTVMCQWGPTPLPECLQGCTPARDVPLAIFAELLFTALGCQPSWMRAKKSFFHLRPRPSFSLPTTHHLGPLPLTQCCATAKMAPVRRAPYKDFLQPALHRRFTSTATILLAIAFVEAVVLASWDSRQLCPAPRTNSFRRQPANIVRALQSSGRSSRSAQLAFEPFLSSSAALQSSSSESHNTMSASVPPTPACRPSSNTP